MRLWILALLSLFLLGLPWPGVWPSGGGGGIAAGVGGGSSRIMLSYSVQHSGAAGLNSNGNCYPLWSAANTTGQICTTIGLTEELFLTIPDGDYTVTHMTCFLGDVSTSTGWDAADSITIALTSEDEGTVPETSPTDIATITITGSAFVTSPTTDYQVFETSPNVDFTVSGDYLYLSRVTATDTDNDASFNGHCQVFID